VDVTGQESISDPERTTVLARTFLVLRHIRSLNPVLQERIVSMQTDRFGVNLSQEYTTSLIRRKTR
jgi:hypothetical protein